VTYHGTVTRGVNLPDAFAIGDPFTVVFTYESTTSPTPHIGPQEIAWYQHTITALSWTVGSYSGYTEPGQDIYVTDDYNDVSCMPACPYDMFLVSIDGSALHGMPIHGKALTLFGLQLTDPTLTAFTSTALPLTQLDPAKFVSHGITDPPSIIALNWGSNTDPDRGFVQADFSTPTPEPATSALFFVGAVVATLYRKRVGR
jgi:hypothetical protein